MGWQRLPAVLLAASAFGFLVWAVLLVAGPGGSIVLEWVILGVAGVLVLFGLASLRSEEGRAQIARWLLTGFAVFGAVAVIGLTADDNSSRTWVRLGWAALLVGLVTAVAAWWGARRVNRNVVLAGGVVGLVVIAGGWGIAANCDKSLQRSWCEPAFEQEETLAMRVQVDGELHRSGRAGGDTGGYVRTHLTDGIDIESVTTAPAGFVFEERPVQSIEVARGRYTADSGPDANCQIDVKVESVPAGNLQSLVVTCLGTG
ncbi:MAG: hypothetical protein ACRDZM_17730 [Acidimicrobiia bacterium]